MQTFLPYADYKLSAQVLDSKRLNKQIVEARQIWHNLVRLSSGWINHPATRMWIGYEDSLRLYIKACHDEWVSRGNSPHVINLKAYEPRIDENLNLNADLPNWFGGLIHATHQSNLLRKDAKYYGKFFNISPCLAYYWPRSNHVRSNDTSGCSKMLRGLGIG